MIKYSRLIARNQNKALPAAVCAGMPALSLETRRWGAPDPKGASLAPRETRDRACRGWYIRGNASLCAVGAVGAAAMEVRRRATLVATLEL